jgi:hypothetical protein
VLVPNVHVPSDVGRGHACAGQEPDPTGLGDQGLVLFENGLGQLRRNFDLCHGLTFFYVR